MPSRSSSGTAPRISADCPASNSRAWTGAALGKVTVLGASAAQGQTLGDDVSEVLSFDRSLRFDETEAVTKYLNARWGLN